MPSFQKRLIVEQFQGNYLKLNLVKPFPRAPITPSEFQDSEEVDFKQITSGTKTGSRVFLA